GVRVGNYKFDNTNFFDVSLGFFGSGDDEESFKQRQVPVNMDYNSFRRELWLSTDAAYKQSAEILSKKEATIKNRLRKDTTDDFLKITPEKKYDTIPIPSIDLKKYENLCRDISAIFNKYPEISISTVGIEYLPKRVYYVNSEGMEYIKTELYIGLEVVAATQAKDGMPLANIYSCYGLTPSDLPTADSLQRAVEFAAKKLVEELSAKQLEESYSGPVLFEGQAAAALFGQVFAPNLVAQRAAMTESGVQENDRYGAFQSKIGGRVLPEFMSVNAYPTKLKYNGVPLAGYYKIDDDGILAKDILLVENGYLKNLLSSRVPTRRVRQTNGHRRGGAPMISNIVMNSDAEHSKSRKELTEKMLKLCMDRELPFGIIVRKAMDLNIMYTTLYRLSYGSYPVGSYSGKIALLEAYKVYPDGREELIRGIEAAGFTAQSFKDILFTGKSEYVNNYLAPAVVSPFVSGGSQYVASSVSVPDLLFEDGEISIIESDFPKPPILSNPQMEMK
ncbi:MAG: hypothetical protein QG635_493, partial [Bacteroidota bacterium]|nr:hypothetical protein [Bacteroidota bacterium]